MQTSIALSLFSSLFFWAATPASVHAQASGNRPAAAGGAAGTKPGGNKPGAVGKTTPAASGEEGLRQVIAAYGKALAEGDMAAMAKFWTADGNYVDPRGRSVKAREALEKMVQLDKEGLKGSIPHLALETESLRLVTPEVALEDGVSELATEGEKPIFRGRYLAVWVKQQGSWLLSSLRESLAPPPSPVDRLNALEWLVGDWEADEDGNTITVSAKWTANKVYLLCDVVVEHDERVTHRFTERIAWDPLTRRLKGWKFDADGGMGEGSWTQHGDTWVVRSSGVTRDGRTTSAKNIYSDISTNSFTLRSAEAQVDGESKPEFELHFKRLPADQ
ncbi:MAG TPA: nuclear transport factor 2 family protein [Pirellulales bacterium]|nr:nuclear transport factor 2 family protein [Pirellulales bacterium]